MNPHPAIRRAGILLQNGRHRQAIAALEAALSAEPDSPAQLEAPYSLARDRLARTKAR